MGCIHFSQKEKRIKKEGTNCFPLSSSFLNKCALKIFQTALVECGNVVTHGQFFSALGAKIFRDKAIFALFLLVDRLAWQPKTVAFARFHFNEGILALFVSDNIRFAKGSNVIARHNAVTLLFEIFYNEFFPSPSQKFVVKVLR